MQAEDKAAMEVDGVVEDNQRMETERPQGKRRPEYA